MMRNGDQCRVILQTQLKVERRKADSLGTAMRRFASGLRHALYRSAFIGRANVMFPRFTYHAEPRCEISKCRYKWFRRDDECEIGILIRDTVLLYAELYRDIGKLDLPNIILHTCDNKAFPVYFRIAEYNIF